MNIRLLCKLLAIVSTLIGGTMVFSLPWGHPALGHRTKLPAVDSLEIRGLTALSISKNNIAGATPFTALTSLTWLDLFGNQIVDLEPLTTLTNLTALNLIANDVEDLEPLLKLVNLEVLKVGFNPFDCVAQADSISAMEKAGVEVESDCGATPDPVPVPL